MSTATTNNQADRAVQPIHQRTLSNPVADRVHIPVNCQLNCYLNSLAQLIPGDAYVYLHHPVGDDPTEGIREETLVLLELNAHARSATFQQDDGGKATLVYRDDRRWHLDLGAGANLDAFSYLLVPEVPAVTRKCEPAPVAPVLDPSPLRMPAAPFSVAVDALGNLQPVDEAKGLSTLYEKPVMVHADLATKATVMVPLTTAHEFLDARRAADAQAQADGARVAAGARYATQ
ncbi:MAG: hypothetical protein JKY23_05345 [Nitrospinaceae bacterium]|nr:hypothetical protein [Nitrospinaceae bacterium]